MPRHSPRPGFVTAAVALLLICLLTLLPAPGEVARAAATPLTCIFCGDFGAVDFLLNIILFVPLGIGLSRLGFSWRRAVVLGALLSCGIELLQMKVIVGRDASLGDVLANTAGTGVGVLLSMFRAALFLPTAGAARRLVGGWACCLLAIWACTAWALGPDFPRGGQWFGAWAPELGNYAQFHGKVLMVEAGGEPVLPGGPLSQSRFEASVSADPSMTATAVLGPMPRRLAPVGLVVDGDKGNVLFLGQERQDLTFAYRMRGIALMLWNPRINLKDGMAGEAGDTVVLRVALNGNTVELRSERGGLVRTRALPLSASWGWALIAPWDSVLGEEVHELTAFWIAGLLALLAFWGVLAGGAALLVVPATVAGMLGIVPMAAGFAPAHWSEWLAAGVGVLLGALAGARARRARARHADAAGNLVPEAKEAAS